jgi:hypothetical protein
MPSSLENQKPKWLAESLRLTVFVPPYVQPQGEGLWGEIIGTAPENKMAKPSRGEFVEAGLVLGNTLTLSIQPGRIDWILSPNLSSEEDLDGVKSIGKPEEAAKSFSEIVSKWLPDCPSSVRLAYGVVLLERVESREEGYLRLRDLIRSVQIDPKSEDFFYQINRPRESTSVEGMRLNRLSRWSVASYQPVRFSFTIQQNQPAHPSMYAHSGVQTMACRAELDLSTPATTLVELPHDKVKPICSEFVDLALEIALRGDLP